MQERPSVAAEHNAQATFHLHDVVQQSFADPEQPELLAAQRQLFWRIIEEAEATQTLPQAREVIRQYGGVVDYLWFQPADAPLPDGLMLQQNDVLGGDIYSNARIGGQLDDELFEEITEVLLPFGLERLLSVREANLGRNSTVLFRELQEFAAGSPVGRWVETFGSSDVGRPRLTAYERMSREAANFGEETRALRQFGNISVAMMRTVPGLSRRLARRNQALEEEPGSQRQVVPVPDARGFVRRVEHYLADLTDGEVASVEYDGEMVYLLDASGEVVAEHVDSDVYMLLEEERIVGGHATLGGDDIAMEMFVEAFKIARGQGSPGRSMFIGAVDHTAANYAGLLPTGMLLKQPSPFTDAIDLVKMPPRDTPKVPYSGFFHEDSEEDPPPLTFNRRVLSMEPAFGGDDADSEEAAKALALRRDLRRGAAPEMSLAESFGRSYTGLLGDLRRMLLLPLGSPDEAIYAALPYRRKHDPVVRCIGMLCAATYELRSTGQLAEPTRSALSLSYMYVQDALEQQAPDLRRQPGVAQPWPKDVFIALGRAFGPIAQIVTGED